MKLTKEDFMRLPKERLAELLVELQDMRVEPVVVPNTTPYVPAYPRPWWEQVTYEITCRN